MNYLINIIIIIYINFNIVFAQNINDKIIIFKINDKAYTSIDLNFRKNYLKLLNENIEYNEENLLKDFISVLLFYNFYNISKKNIKDLNINETYKNIFNKYKNEKSNKELNKMFKSIGEKKILLNLKYDLVRKKIIEDVLNSKRDEIFNEINELDLLYDYSVKNIILDEKDFNKVINEYNNIKNNQDFLNFKNFLLKNEIEFITKNNNIIDIEKIDKKIKNGIISNKKLFNYKFNDYVNIIFIEKKFESYEGITVKLISLETKNKINDKMLSCSELNNIDDDKIDNKYTGTYIYSQLNQEIQKNLFNVNDFIILSNNNIFNYIFLCELNFNQNILNEININKKINLFANNIEKEFVKKYSGIYNLEIIE